MIVGGKPSITIRFRREIQVPNDAEGQVFSSQCAQESVLAEIADVRSVFVSHEIDNCTLRIILDGCLGRSAN